VRAALSRHRHRRASCPYARTAPRCASARARAAPAAHRRRGARGPHHISQRATLHAVTTRALSFLTTDACARSAQYPRWCTNTECARRMRAAAADLKSAIMADPKQAWQPQARILQHTMRNKLTRAAMRCPACSALCLSIALNRQRIGHRHADAAPFARRSRGTRTRRARPERKPHRRRLHRQQQSPQTVQTAPCRPSDRRRTQRPRG
jgi:hypothetical protein